MQGREEGNLYNDYDMQRGHGFKLSDEGKRIMMVVMVFLLLAFIYLFIRVKIDKNFFDH